VDNHVDILFANTDEILSLYETDSLDKALDELTKTKTVACVTRSEKGSIIQDSKRRYHVKACPVDKVVDTTGAGDQYAAGVLAGRAMGLDWADAGHLGSLCAAEVISHYGARPEKSLHDLALGA
jgi:sugar/nucleoside kinase (ribokinase family)